MSRRRNLVATLGSGADLLGRQGVQFVVLLVLARLVTPAEFGTVALLGVVVAVAVVAADMGMTTALVQSRHVTDDDRDTAFWSTVAMGGALTAVGVLVSDPLAAAFGRPELAAEAAVLSTAVLTTGAGIVPTALLVRRLAFTRLVVVGCIAGCTAGAVGIVLALRGQGIWALVATTATMPATNTALLLVAGGFRPRVRWSRTSARHLLGAGRWVLGANLVDSAFVRVQAVVVGVLFGPAPLGRYQRADSTQQLLADFSSTVVGRVALPVFVRSADRPDLLRAGFRTGVRSVTAVNAPVMALVAALSAPLLEVLYGEQWVAAAPLLSILCLSGLLWPLHTMALTTLYSLSRNREVFRLDVVKKGMALGALAVGATFGLYGVAWAQVAFGVAAVLINGWAVRRAIGWTLGQSLREVAPATAVAVSTGAVVALAAARWSPSPVVEVAVLGTIGMAAYLLACSLLRVSAVVDLWVALRPTGREVADA